MAGLVPAIFVWQVGTAAGIGACKKEARLRGISRASETFPGNRHGKGCTGDAEVAVSIRPQPRTGDFVPFRPSQRGSFGNYRHAWWFFFSLKSGGDAFPPARERISELRRGGAEMMRDIIMALVLLGLAAIPIVSWCSSTPHMKAEKIEAKLGR
jgi:hypothetical protein